MSKSFRGIPVKGWIIVTKNYRDDFEKEINNLMETYNFEDFQFSVDDEVFYAAILVSEKKKMKIGFIGSQGVGKTTLAYEIAYNLKENGNDVLVLSEVARSCPLPINEETTRESQLWILGKQITREQSSKGKILITDRTILDNLSYSLYTDKEFFESMKPFIKEYMKTYDAIFYLKPKDEYLLDDGFRSTNIEFRDIINNIMTNLLKELDIEYYNVEGTTNRSKYVLKIINKKIGEKKNGNNS